MFRWIKEPCVLSRLVCRLHCWPLAWILECMCVKIIIMIIIIINHRSCSVYVCVFWCAYVYFFFFYQSVTSAVVHVVISHGGAWRPVAHCVLCSSDGHGLSCSTAHFLFSICPHGWEAFFSLQLYEIIEMEKVLFIFCREKRIPSRPSPSFLEPDHWCGFHLCLMFFG